MLPSMTVVSGEGADVWVTVDAAVSNDLFYFEHQPLRADIAVMLPDGTPGEVKNKATGRYRTTLDVQIQQRGTYKIYYASEGVMGSYKLNGEEVRHSPRHHRRQAGQRDPGGCDRCAHDRSPATATRFS
jgi:hypothetical protein